MPAFTGLAAPYWRSDVKATLSGLSLGSGKAQLARAVLEAVVYQTADLLQAMQQDGLSVQRLRVDGGMTTNRWFLQALADITQQTVERCQTTDATAMGAAFLVAMQLGLYQQLQDISRLWRSDWLLEPELAGSDADKLYQRWQSAVDALLHIKLTLD